VSAEGPIFPTGVCKVPDGISEASIKAPRQATSGATCDPLKFLKNHYVWGRAQSCEPRRATSSVASARPTVSLRALLPATQ
jgi:hypothetical protein